MLCAVVCFSFLNDFFEFRFVPAVACVHHDGNLGWDCRKNVAWFAGKACRWFGSFMYFPRTLLVRWTHLRPR